MHSSHYLCTPVWIHVVKGFSIAVTIHVHLFQYYSFKGPILYLTSVQWSNGQHRQQESMFLVSQAAQHSNSPQSHPKRSEWRTRGLPHSHKTEREEGKHQGGCILGEIPASGESAWVTCIAPSLHPPNVLTHLCHDDVPNKAERPSSTLNCKNFHWTITICNTTWQTG